MPLQKNVENLANKGSTFGSNLRTYNKGPKGGVFHGSKTVKVVNFTTINKGVKFGAGATNVIGFIGDVVDYNDKVIGPSKLTYNTASTLIGIMHPEVGVGFFILNNSESGKEIDAMLEDIDERIQESKARQYKPSGLLGPTFISAPK